VLVACLVFLSLALASLIESSAALLLDLVSVDGRVDIIYGPENSGRHETAQKLHEPNDINTVQKLLIIKIFQSHTLLSLRY